MSLRFDNNLNINELDRKFNMHDKIDEDTVLLHTTNRITQPWKINLQIDFERN